METPTIMKVIEFFFTDFWHFVGLIIFTSLFSLSFAKIVVNKGGIVNNK